MFTGKRIVLGVTGGIAAYKAADIVSALIKREATVRVVMTRAARSFIAPLTLAVLSGHPVAEDGLTAGDGLTHIHLTRDADLLLIAPATANIIGKLAAGIADDLLTTVALAHEGPVLICPAMNSRMYRHPVVQRNIRMLRELGCHFAGPGEGRLACGDQGPGRLAGVDRILEAVESVLGRVRDLEKLRVLVTAGPTREPLDAVRFLSNRSTGRMGYAVADAARSRGALVTLVSGPTALPAPPGVDLVQVTTAQEMCEAVMSRFPDCDVLIKAAAVADFRPREVQSRKIKKGGAPALTLVLERTPDILSALGRARTHQILVGFAAETEEAEERALMKSREKGVDLVVANDVTRPGAGFEVETNIVTLVYPDGRMIRLPEMSKRDVAHRILDAVAELRREGMPGGQPGLR
ncbi:MAG: bifunctional phosphopantothenoylcysteine decarboxylase/phosphopantothenate--cysteine ligase CoaBC [Bacillota bacterium]|nr:bifunctional phosphopantothenoylcysteine decarboxylase/phosphopantothenate--cysteine ligase CoaBC [Bacillota bacterium]